MKVGHLVDKYIISEFNEIKFGDTDKCCMLLLTNGVILMPNDVYLSSLSKKKGANIIILEEMLRCWSPLTIWTTSPISKGAEGWSCVGESDLPYTRYIIKGRRKFMVPFIARRGLMAHHHRLAKIKIYDTLHHVDIHFHKVRVNFQFSVQLLLSSSWLLLLLLL